MGVFDACLACICGRKDDVENHGETRPLLPEDGYRNGYGAGSLNGQRGGTAAGGGYQPDSESVRREREALDGICHSMSDSVEDLFLAKARLNYNGNGNNYGYDHGNKPHAEDDDEDGSSSSRPRTPELSQSGSQEMALRTIRKGGSGPISNALRRQSEGWRAVQDAIG